MTARRFFYPRRQPADRAAISLAERSPRSWQKRINDLILVDEGEAVALCVLLSRRFGGSPDPQVRLDAADVLSTSARGLGLRGRGDAAREVAHELRACFASDPSFGVQTRIAAALSIVAEVQARDGQVAAGIATYDEILALVAASEELTRRGTGATALLAKARLVALLDGRPEEAIILLDSALLAITDAIAGGAKLKTRQAAVAVTAKLDYLCDVDRYKEARGLGEQLSDVLGKVLAGESPEHEPTRIVASEVLLAAELAAIVNDGECWAVFDAREHISPSDAAKRAVRLYSVSDPWALSASATEPSPADSAAAIVRTIADGYALLSQEWDQAERDSLPLPRRADLEHHQFIRQQGVDDWASTAGHPLSLRPDHEPVAPSQTSPPDSGTYTVSASVARDIVKCMYVWEFAHILKASDVGLEALRYKQFSGLSISYLRFALGWHRKLLSEGAPAEPIAVAVVLWAMAEGLFAITHRETGSAVAFGSTTASLRDLLHEMGGHAWLAHQDVLLPAWTELAAA